MKFNVKSVLMIAAVLVAALVLSRPLISSFSKNPFKEGSGIRELATAAELQSVIDGSGATLLVLDLYAPWCGPCRALAPRLERLATKYAGKVSFYRIDVDAHPETAARFGISAVPNIVFVKNGLTVASLVGIKPTAAYEKVIEEYSAAPTAGPG